MIIYKSLYKSLQIIPSITINNKNSQNDHYQLCYDVDFSEKCGRPGAGGVGLKIRTHADKGRGKNGQKFAAVLYGWPLMQIAISKYPVYLLTLHFYFK